jgi:multiple sugar transport system substrate-binding protein
MKNSMRLLVALGMALLMLMAVAPVFAGGKQEAAPAGQAAAPVKIRIFHMTWIPGMIDVVNAAADRFMKENPGIQIEQTRVSWTDAPAQLLVDIMGGTPPDIAEANPTMVAQFRSMGAYADVTDAIPQKLKDNLLPGALNVIQTPDGRIDGFPADGATWGFFYRDDLLQKAGITSHPRTWDELIAAAKKLTVSTKGDGVIDQWGFGVPVQAENAVQFWECWMWQAGTPIDKYANGKWVSDLGSPEAKKGTQFMVDLVQKYKVMPATIVNMDWEAVTNGFAFGNFAIIYNGNWIIPALRQKAPGLEGKWSTGLTPSAAPGMKTATMGFPNAWNILKASKNKDAAIKFMNFFYLTQYKEGKTYADEYAYVPLGMNFTKDYVTWAKAHYEPVLQPFLDIMEFSRPLVMAPKWQQFAELFGRATVQNMMQGKVSVDDGLAALEAQLTQLQQ